MGTSVMFTSNVSAYTRAYEVTILDDDIPPRIIEQTRTLIVVTVPNNSVVPCSAKNAK